MATIDAAREAFYAALLDDDAEELYERAPCGYLSTAPDGTIVKVNQTFLIWTGFDRADLVGRRRFVDLLTGGGRIYHETHYAPMLQGQGSAREIALDIVASDGRRLPALVNAVLERDVDGEPVVIRVAAFDATDRRKYEQELLRAKRRAEDSERRATTLAQTLQQTLIPPALPELEGLDIAAAYRPAGDGREVGGDFYDLFEVADGAWVLTIGDVCGKGAEAAVVTALARYTVRAAAARHSSPSQVLALLNEALNHHHHGRFCTVAVARLQRSGADWSVTHASGGHPLPLFWNPSVEPRAVGCHGTLVGAFDEASFEDSRLTLQPGDGLVFYTDGVTEARRGQSFLGLERLQGAVPLDGSASDVVDRVLDEALEFQAGLASDDIAIVVLRVPPTAPG